MGLRKFRFLKITESIENLTTLIPAQHGKQFQDFSLAHGDKLGRGRRGGKSPPQNVVSQVAGILCHSTTGTCTTGGRALLARQGPIKPHLGRLCSADFSPCRGVWTSSNWRWAWWA